MELRDEFYPLAIELAWSHLSVESRLKSCIEPQFTSLLESRRMGSKSRVACLKIQSDSPRIAYACHEKHNEFRVRNVLSFEVSCGKNFSIFKFLSLLVLYLHHIRLKSISLCTHMINVCKIMLEISWDLPDRSNSRTSAWNLERSIDRKRFYFARVI